MNSHVTHFLRSSARRPSPGGYAPAVEHAGSWKTQKSRRGVAAAAFEARFVKRNSVLSRPGSDLLFQALRLSTIGAGEFNGRVRDGIGFRLPANTTRSAKNRNQESGVRSQDDSRRQSMFEASCSVSASWFETCGFAALLTMRRTVRPHPEEPPKAASRRMGPVTGIEDKSDQADRAIRTGKLNALRRLHTRPINVVVYHGSV
jgi:hypothetical protein